MLFFQIFDWKQLKKEIPALSLSYYPQCLMETETLAADNGDKIDCLNDVPQKLHLPEGEDLYLDKITETVEAKQPEGNSKVKTKLEESEAIQSSMEEVEGRSIIHEGNKSPTASKVAALVSV